ncbi:hypothetical protein JGS22_010330 [Streptomyces sp. P38-E01]|uniref:Uncharacterized protein n=1 Tax=Streptomyces tardus TaxID=2780544 RepID=A0A949N1M5_9ACTN|nr:hypothetical protein [Streptomyces tardus]MBU7597995.1 hypothetical protein [Streptomyces tardus]
MLERTGEGMRLVYRHTQPSGVELAELGWEARLGDLRWIRPRRDRSFGFYEFGFVDGSWISISLGYSTQAEAIQDFLALFPAHLHLPAEENPSKGLAKSLEQEWKSRQVSV